MASALTLVLMAACGQSAAPASVQLTKVKVVAGNPTTSRIPYYIAVSKGFMRQEGLDVETESMSGGGADAVKVMGSGAVDFHVGQLVDDVNINQAGVHIIGVAMLINKSSNGISIAKQSVGKIKTMADAKGPDVTIGVSGIGSGTWQFVVYNAQLAGVKKEELQIVAVQPATTEAAFKTGRIQLGTAGDPTAFQMVQNGTAERFVDVSDDATSASSATSTSTTRWRCRRRS
jgi:NitT/TauT family transport system substrate-binding protein